MRKAALAAVLCCLASASTDALADQHFYNQAIPVGTHDYFDENIIVESCWVTGSSGGTVVIRVFGGSLTVTGFNGRGADGTDGDNGISCPPDRRPPTSGSNGKPGYSFVLETWPSLTGDTAVDLSLNVGCGGLTAAGGRGGSGGQGSSACQVNCTFYDAYDGATGMPGGSGGSVTLRSSGNLNFSGGVDTTGGQGGNGGSGGSASYPGTSPGLGREGRNGGQGGPITLEHTGYAPANATCGFGVGYGGACVGGLSTGGGAGGSGGAGGTGGTGASVPKNGGNGGPGANGGAIIASLRNLSFAGWPDIGSGAYTGGGQGGNGGNGGDGSSATCFQCDDQKWALSGCKGAIGGLGGAGGTGGAITYSVANLAAFSRSGQVTTGGNGGSAGTTGSSGLGDSDPCGDHEDCPGSYYPINGAPGSPAGAGGPGGIFTTNAFSISLGTGTALVTEGGDGAYSVPGGNASHVCCDPGPPALTGTGGQGGAGGKGGKGANVVLTYTLYSAVPNVFYTCGGDGRDGGQGGDQWGPGGIGGAAGSNGYIKRNNLTQIPLGCSQHYGITGPVGPDAPICSIR